MHEQEFALFDTPVGCCGIVWGGRGVVGVQLPEGPASLTAVRVRRRFPLARQTTLPAAMAEVVVGIGALLRGRGDDLAWVVLDMAGVPPFPRRVYQVTRGIAPGKTMSYGEVARRLGEPGAARAVGQALGRNPFPLVVPCHRVVAADGRPGGFSASGGITTKLRLLALERPDLLGGDGALGCPT